MSDFGDDMEIHGVIKMENTEPLWIKDIPEGYHLQAAQDYATFNLIQSYGIPQMLGGMIRDPALN